MSFRPIVLTVTAAADQPSFDRRGEPVSIGVTCPRGMVKRSVRWALTDQAGRHLPVQTTILDRWGDGSVRWMLAEFAADLEAGLPSFYALAPDDITETAAPAITIEHAGETIRVATGEATIDVPRSGRAFISGVTVNDRALLESSVIVAEDSRGRAYEFSIERAIVERAGRLRAVLRLDGVLRRQGFGGQVLVDQSTHPWLDATVRLYFFAGLGTVKAEVTITNPRAAKHPGGRWDLGDAGSVLIRDLSIRIVPMPHGDADVWGSLDAGDHMEPAGERFAVYQESSGGRQWQHVNHVNRDGSVPARFRGFRAIRGGREVAGLRATPIASIGGGDTRVSVALPYFWEVFPKAIEADASQCEVAMFPRTSDVHELQGGERSTLTLAVCFGRDTVTAEPLAWIRSPLRVAADAISYRQAGAWAPPGAGSGRSAEGYEALVNTAISGPESFKERREAIDEYGWRNFGDLYADHEGALVSHYNNQYDAIAGFITRYLQTGDHRWWSLADELAGHVTDIDLYHTTRDRAAYNGGYFWHTQHYQAAGTATHRAYSRRAGPSGGGPCSEHNYTTGLMLHYFLSGSERSRAAVIQLANWVIDMDDGKKSRFRWIDRRDTGLASVTRSPDFHGPGRGAGNSINALIDAHRLTGEPRYLEKADALIARAVHPDDDPEAINPLDAENRWSYTVFLQTLGKYLEHRADRGLIDAKYQYARSVLLKYALWMCASERPYLETPEKLEFPTETWAAQDIRKAAVFEFAARHTHDDRARACFQARADGFVDYAVTALTNAPTGRLTRPLVLLLAYGFQRPMFDLQSVPVPVFPRNFARESFTPLRQRLARRLAWTGAGLSAAAVVVIVLLIS